MSDIKKRLILEAKLDRTALNRDISQLKKDLGKSVSFESIDLSSFKRSFEGVAKAFASEIKKAFKDIGQVSRSSSLLKRESKGTVQARRLSEQTRKFNSESQDVNFTGIAKKIATEERVKEQARKKREREEIKHVKRIENERDKAQSRRIMQASRSGPGSSFGEFINPEKSRMNNLKADLMAKHGGTLAARRAAASGGMGAGAMAGTVVAGGAAALGAAGMVAGAGVGMFARERERKVQRIQQQTDASSSLLRGDIMGGNIRERGRSNISEFESDLGAFQEIVRGTLENRDLNWKRSAEIGRRNAAETSGQADYAQSEMSRNATSRVLGLRSSRVGVMRGGGIGNEQLNSLQAQGSKLGFSDEQTLQQMQGLRESIGGKALSQGVQGDNGFQGTLLGSMQDIFQKTGVTPGEQGGFMETLAGAGGSRGVQGSNSQMIDILKKGTAAGIREEKLSQYMKATQEVLTANVGVGRIDVEGVSGNLARFAKASAEGGDVKQLDISRAARIQQQIINESTATSGIAGLGNLQGIKDALGPDATPGQMLAALTIKSSDSAEDIKGALGISLKKAKALKKNKSKNLEEGREFVGDETLARGIVASEKGVSAAAIFRREQIEKGARVKGDGTLAPSATETEEGKSLIQQALAKNMEFTEGLGKNFAKLNDNTMEAAIQMGIAAKKIKESFEFIELQKQKYNLKQKRTTTI